MKNCKWTYFVFLGILVSVAADCMNLEEFRNFVYEKNPSVAALKKSQEASVLKLRKVEEPTAMRLFSGR
jgi:hypothetical protein